MHLKGNSILSFLLGDHFPASEKSKIFGHIPRGQDIVLTIKEDKINKMKKSKIEKFQPSSYLGRAVSFHF